MISSSIKILAIDDNKDFLILVSTILLELGYEVETCNSMEGIVYSCESNIPDIIFLDMRIPGLETIEICKQIESICGSIPYIVGLTGYHPRDIESQTEGTSIRYCVQKPLELNDLNHILLGGIERARKEKEIRHG